MMLRRIAPAACSANRPKICRRPVYHFSTIALTQPDHIILFLLRKFLQNGQPANLFPCIISLFHPDLLPPSGQKVQKFYKCKKSSYKPLFTVYNCPYAVCHISLSVPDHRTLLRLFPYIPTFQSENHIPGTLKIPYVLLPAHAAFTMLQTNKLLFHFPSAVRAYLFAPAFLLYFRCFRFHSDHLLYFYTDAILPDLSPEL